MKKKDRELILSKTKGVCFYCGCDLNGTRWHADQFHPIRRNGDGTMMHPERDTAKNLVPACASCNKLKSSLDVDYLRVYIYNFVDSLNKYTNQYKFAKKYGQIQETRKPVVFWFESSGYDMSEINSVIGGESCTTQK